MPQDLQDPDCEVVLSPEEYPEFQQMLTRPPRVIPALMRLLEIRRLKGDVDMCRELAEQEDKRTDSAQAAVAQTEAQILKIEMVREKCRAAEAKIYPGED